MTETTDTPPPPSEGWAVALEGDPFDLDDVDDAFEPSHSPWIEEFRDGDNARLLLRSTAWADLTETSEVMEDARRLLDQINGIHLIMQHDARPLSLGRTFRFDREGKPMRFLIAATADIVLAGDRVRIQITGAGGTPRPAEPSEMQSWIGKAASSEPLADLLVFLTRADNWFDIYKAIEEIQRLGGGQRTIEQRWPDWGRVRQTANCHRHAPNPDKPFPPVPATIAEARQLILQAAREVI